MARIADELVTTLSDASIDRCHDCRRDGADDRASCRGAGLVIDLRNIRRRAGRSDIVYFAFVNYTTLGYGDVTPVERWHLLGPMTAMNGVLLFGWSTAVIFEVLRMTLMAGGDGAKPGWAR